MPRSRIASLSGFSLIELMVGVTVGIVLLLLVSQFFVGRLIGNTAMLQSARLNQELRSIMDFTVRDLRRAGYWGGAIQGVWYDGTTGIVANPLQAITVNPNSISFSYDVNGNGSLDVTPSETFTIQFNATDHTVELVQGDNPPSQLSDPYLTRITDLSFEGAFVEVTVPCIRPTVTPPVLTLRSVTVTIAGELASDPEVKRTLTETVRIRDDPITGSCPTGSGT